MVHGLRALERAGFEVMEGEEVTERARSIKGPDDILAMRCAHHACEAAMAEMEEATRLGVPKGDMSEDAIWAELHKGNIKRGGEWIETRLLASGKRTNPWFMGALLASMVLTLTGFQGSAIPTGLSNAAQLVIGVSLGVRFQREFVHTAPRWLASAAAGTLAMMASGATRCSPASSPR